ncbi:LOW QUALITY PROTEIN: hypothetical protein GQ55_9G462400 [Panicum hallii var. hallii]|uniref:F-box associated beta-propeller type 1 domain-containing protein n=1 Tax=Panicum hallii var. hallii TaxID=1504633 RepID=A0A2T7CC68_9POAL|nr:LOW QUALITY PROTEIN: hypothetical protein GQ55_9G462400 [Panicum hallii var. hallii]
MAAPGPSLPPDDDVAEILARLPARSIGRFRAGWNDITSRSIADRVLARRPAAVTAILKGSSWLELGDEPHPVDIVRFDGFRGRWHPDVHRTPPCPRAVSLDDMTISTEDFRSCVGRVFPRKPQPGDGTGYMLWNPLTDSCAVVSAPAGHGRIIGGYAHPVTGRFHLIHSSDVAVSGDRDLVAPITVRILGVGDSAGWREVPLPPAMAAGCSESETTTISMRGERDHSVSLHGNLHWLVQPGSGKALLAFDTVREKFRFMAAPDRPGLDLTTARSRVVPGGKLCVLALTKEQPRAAMEVWVLDDYSGSRSWRLRETARLDRTHLSPAVFAAAAAVEVVEGVHEGEEIFVQLELGILAYGVQSKVWCRVSVGRFCSTLLMYRESVMQPEISFGKAFARVLPR